MANDGSSGNLLTAEVVRRSHGHGALVAFASVAAVLATALMAAPGIWYIAATGTGSVRLDAVMSALNELAELDAGWERAVLRLQREPAPPEPAAAAPALDSVTTRLQTAAHEAASPALQASASELVRAVKDKAALVARYHSAHGATRTALRDALALEPEIARLLREAWRDAPDRQRLIATDNVVMQLMAEAQRYHYAPADPLRKQIDATLADLRGAVSTLPDPLKAAAVRLESHVVESLRTKTLEQAEFGRLHFHDTGPRIRALAREAGRELGQIEATRQRDRVYLTAYFCALLVLIGYLAARIVRRELALRAPSANVLGVAVEPPPLDPTPPSAVAPTPVEPPPPPNSQTGA